MISWGGTNYMEHYEKNEDICTHEGEDPERFLGAVVPPIFQNSLFTSKPGQPSEYVYTRVSNPTIEAAEVKIASMERGEEAKCFSSGMAAISAAVFSCIRKDSHVICVGNVYGGTSCVLENYCIKFGVTTTFVTGEDPQEIEDSIRPETCLIFLESPSSIIFTIPDIRRITDIAVRKGITTVIDNTWATPIYQNPILLGIDMVVHSASKYLGGHSDLVGGVIVGRKKSLMDIANNERSLIGACMDPHQAWLLLRGLRTLPVRMKQHSENAHAVASFLEKHTMVERVIYPGLKSHPQHELAKKQMTGCSGLMSFVMKDMSLQNVKAFFESLQIFRSGPSWGGFESLALPLKVKAYTKEAARLSVKEGFVDLIRISVGLEDKDTLIEALDMALKSGKMNHL
jgi:cystathionine beta-lyase/cystathionine gamma-synthase